MIGVLGISHKDIRQAGQWLRWASFLCTQDGGSCKGERLVIVVTRKVLRGHHEALKRAIIPSEGMFDVEYVMLADMQERGYPGSASHLFLRSLEYCEQVHPGKPILWLEADAIPMRPGWFQSIANEYADCPMPFMGHLERSITQHHLAGVAVYPPNWRELSPLLATCDKAPDIPHWGRGKGQAFDVYAAPEVFPLSAQSHTIQQIFGNPIFTHDLIGRINAEAELLHQSKDGRLITLLASQYPQYTPWR